MEKEKDLKVTDILKRLPEVYSIMFGQKVKLPAGGTAVVRCRKRGLQTKPALYLWDLTRGCYVSSLKPLDSSNKSFLFDIRKGEDVEPYKLVLVNDCKLEVKAVLDNASV